MNFRSPYGDRNLASACVWIPLLVVLALALPPQLCAQQDSSSTADTLAAPGLEKMLEGSVQPDNSPLLDLLPLSTSRQTARIESRTRVSTALQHSAGYLTGAYPGSPLKVTQRIRLSDGDHFSAGFLMEKDPGEEQLADFVTGHAAISDWGILKRAVVGDFYVESGQGLALWRGADLGKGADVMLPDRRSSGGLKPYLSASESGYLRGAGAEVAAGFFSGTAFASHTSRSASIDSAGRATSLYTSGYFRTESEISKRNALEENLLGLRMAVRLPSATIGVAWVQDAFSRPLVIHEGRIFSGDKTSLLSVDVSAAIFAMSLFGECVGNGKSVAGIFGLRVPAEETFEVIAAVRHYPSSFYALHGVGFGEAGNNERGIYVGGRLKVSPHLRLESYYDRFAPVVSEHGQFPSPGSDFSVEVEGLPMRRLEASVRYLRKAKSKGGIQECKQSGRVMMSYKLSGEITVRGRIDLVAFDAGATSGVQWGRAAYEEVVYSGGAGLSLDTRISWFSTDSYDCAIYEYERDLPGVMTMPVLNGRGVRWYLLVHYKPAEVIDISAKYSDLLRDDLRHLGSGLDELPTNHDNRIGIQLDLRL